MRSRRREITVAERVVFAAGDVYAGGASSLVSVVYLFFLTDIVGLRPGLAGTATLVAKLWDSINDPLMGWLSDRTRTRMGRRRPYILAGSLLLIAGMAVFWLPTPPVDGQVPLMLWAMGSYIVYNSIQTSMAVPYASLSTEITTLVAERDKVNVLRLLFSTVASATITLTAAQLVTLYRAGGLSREGLYLALVAGFGTLFTLVMLGVALFTRERVPLPPRATGRGSGFLARFVAPLRVRAMRRLMAMYLCHSIAIDVVSATLLYYAAYVVAGVASTVFLGAFVLVNIVAFPIVNHLVKRVSKNVIYRTLLPLALAAIWVVALYPSTGPTWGVYVAALLLAVGMSGAQLMSWVILPDVLDEAELETGRHDAGSFAGLMTFTRGVASSFTIFLIGWVLDLAGYLPSGAATQPVAVVWGIRLILLVAVFGLLTTGWLVSRRFPLTRDVVLANAAELARRRAQEEDAPAPDEPVT